MRVNIIGATGAVGSALLQLLIQDSDTDELNYIGRRPLNIQIPKLKFCVSADLKDAIENAPEADVWFCTLGSTMAKAGSKEAFDYVDRQLVVMAGKRAKETGARQFHVVSALGANPDSLVFYNRVKGQMEKELMQLQLISLHIYRPSLIDTSRKESRIGEKFALYTFRALSGLFVGPLKRFKAIKAEKIAACMLKQSKTQSNGILIWNSEQMQD